MRTCDIRPMPTKRLEQDNRAFDRRVKQAGAVVGSILAVGVVAMALAGAFPGRPGQAVTNETEVSAVNAGENKVERAGVLLELETLW
jgi:hypothetical protein